MEKFVLYYDRNYAEDSALPSIKSQKFKKMKIKSIVLAILLLPLFVHAQKPENCSGIVALPKSLYDSFQNTKATLDVAGREITKQRAILNDLQRTYLGCVAQPDVAAMIKNAEDALKTAEANQKTSDEAFDRVDKEVKDFIRAAHAPVAFRYLESYYGDFGRVVTMHLEIQEGKVTVTPSYYQLPGVVTLARQ